LSARVDSAVVSASGAGSISEEHKHRSPGVFIKERIIMFKPERKALTRLTNVVNNNRIGTLNPGMITRLKVKAVTGVVMTGI
jgi:hypothetical protein